MQYTSFYLPLVFPQAEQFPFLSFSISGTIFCPFYLLRVAKTQGIRETSHQFTYIGLSLSTGLIYALRHPRGCRTFLYRLLAAHLKPATYSKPPLSYFAFVPKSLSGVSSSYIASASSGFEQLM